MTNRRLNNDQKVQLLLPQLQKHDWAWYNMGERSTQFAIWISEIAIWQAWLLISHSGMRLMQRIALTPLIGALSIGSLIFTRGLPKGFKNNRNTMITCERLLAMCAPGAVEDVFTLWIPGNYPKSPPTMYCYSPKFPTAGLDRYTLNDGQAYLELRPETRRILHLSHLFYAMN